MQRVGMFYATKEGHARQVAERVGAALKARTLDVAVHDVKDADADAALVRSDAAVLVGSVHLGKHEPELVAFVKAHREHLDSIPAAFLSVCGAEAGAEQGSTPEAREVGGARGEAAAGLHGSDGLASAPRTPGRGRVGLHALQRARAMCDEAHREERRAADGHIARLRLHRLDRARRVLPVSRGRAARTISIMKGAICTLYGPGSREPSRHAGGGSHGIYRSYRAVKSATRTATPARARPSKPRSVLSLRSLM